LDPESDLDVPYVFDFEATGIGKDQVIRVFFTTRRLLRLGPTTGSAFHIDATYKLNQLGFPVFVLGSPDKARKFHIAAICVTSHEKKEDVAYCMHEYKLARPEYTHPITCADGADSISWAHEHEMEESTRTMCYFHMDKDVRKYFGAGGKNPYHSQDKEDFMSDIKDIRLAWHTDVKKKSLELFFVKWDALSILPDRDYLINVLRLFRDSWVFNERTNKWSVCDAPGFDLTNNGVESMNKVLKDDVTHHTLLPLLELFENTLTFLGAFSADRNPLRENYKDFAIEPAPTAGDWIHSFEAVTSNKELYKVIKHDNVAIMLRKNSNLKLTEANYVKLRQIYDTQSWLTFDKYKSFLNKINVIKKDEAGKWSCTCYDYNLKHYCYHEHVCRWKFDGGELGINIPQKYRRTAVVAWKKQSRGRPSRVGSALERMPNVLSDDEAAAADEDAGDDEDEDD